MKLVSHAELLAMPRGTIFQEYAPVYTRELKVFFESGGDTQGVFWYQHLLPRATPGDQGDSLVWPDYCERDAICDYARRWLIWEEADVENFVAALRNPLWYLGIESVGDLLNLELPRT